MHDPRLVIVPAIHAEDVWVHILPHLLKGKAHWEQFYSEEEIHSNLVLGGQQVWLMLEGKKVLGLVLTQIDEFPSVKSLRILFLGGEGFKRSMFSEIHKIETWAKEHNCTLIDILGRDEWLPLLERFGYSTIGRVYRKGL